jgi:GntR family transcriptional regulator, transcriptional repressor for pyruvate dehydrogenase complex
MKVATMVVQRLMNDIATQELKPGDLLPPEREMLAHYAVGRGTLREALRFLELQGILQMKSGPGGGPMVAAPDSRHLANSLGLLLQISDTTFSTVIEARLMLEPQLAALAAERADDELLAALRQSIAAMSDGMDDPRIFLTENRRFHELIATAAGNLVFGYVMASLHWVIDGSRQGVQYPERYRGIVVRAHEQIVAAIEARDPDEARAAMHDHIENMLIYLRRHYPRSLEQPIVWQLVDA